MADQEQLDDFIEALEGLGGSAKNPTPQAPLSWPEVDYEAVKEQLVASHIVLGLLFLKYISDTFEAKHAANEAAKTESCIEGMFTQRAMLIEGLAT